MPRKRLGRILSRFGGATSYQEKVDEVFEFVNDHRPTTDELVGWHRGTFAQENIAIEVTRWDRQEYREAFQEAGLFVAERDNIPDPGTEILLKRSSRWRTSTRATRWSNATTNSARY